MAALCPVRIRGQASKRSIDNRKAAWSPPDVHARYAGWAVLTAVAFLESGAVGRGDPRDQRSPFRWTASSRFGTTRGSVSRIRLLPDSLISHLSGVLAEVCKSSICEFDFHWRPHTKTS